MKIINKVDSGLLLVSKPLDWTSNDVVQFIKHRFSLNKVGHAGTLDPKATGLMILGINDGTKKMHECLHLDKIYELKIKFHFSSESYDMDQKFVYIHLNDKTIKKSDVYAVINNFLNIDEYFQIPPKFSAIKINGVRAYKLARNNISFSIEPKLVNIYDIYDIYFDEIKQELSFKIHCSSGFYIRSLVNDLSIKLNTHAILVYLNRIKISNYDLQKSLDIYKIKNSSLEENDLHDLLVKNLIR